MASMVDAKEIPEAEAWRILRSLSANRSAEFIEDLQSRVGCEIVRGTQVSDTTGASKEIKSFKEVEF